MFVPLWQPASDIFCMLVFILSFEANKYDDDDERTEDIENEKRE